MLPTAYQQYIALSRYSRFREDLGRRETWPETVTRLLDFWTERFPEAVTPVRDELFAAITGLQVMPSMRSLMTAGPALTRDEIAGYNCSFTPVRGAGAPIQVLNRTLRDAGFDDGITVHPRHPTVFDNIMYILLCGTGVGFSVERQDVNELPKLRTPLSRKLYHPSNFPGVDVKELSTYDKAHNTIRVADSKYGWASALRILIVELYNGNYDVQWDLSKVRPAGAALKTFGGRSSGPGPLAELFKFTVDLFRNAQGERLTSIECHDLVCKIASVIVVGGVRRSALISLSNLSDERMRRAKTGAWWETTVHRALANNSAVYTDKPDIGIFMEEWHALYESKSGERGIFNRQAAQAQAARIGRDPNHAFGANPCLTGNTLVAIPNKGLYRIRDLAGTTQDVLTQAGSVAPARFEQTSTAEPIFEVELSNGTILEATEYHNFVLASGQKRAVRDLQIGDALLVSDIEGQFGDEHAPNRAYIDAWMRSDGTWHNDRFAGRKLYLYPPKHQYLEALTNAGLTFRQDSHQDRYVAYQSGTPVLPKDSIPDYVLKGDYETVLMYVLGSLESDGSLSKTSKGWVLQFTSVNRAFLQELQSLLRLFGARGHIAVMHDAGYRPLPDGKGGTAQYLCQTAWRLSVSNPLSLIQHLYPHLVKRGPYTKIESITVIDVRPTSRVEPVFCAGEPTTNSFALPTVVSGNCCEIILRPNQLCNLSEIVIRPDDDLKSLERKAELATILGTLQASLTNFVYLPPEWREACEEERLLGVSLTGIMDHAVFTAVDRSTQGKAKQWLQHLREHVRLVNAEWADTIGINPATARTCIKPSGTVSQLVDSASGIHPRYATRYVRRVRSDIKDPLTQFMLDQGFQGEPDVTNPQNVVFSFPIQAPSHAVLRNDRTAVQQLEHWLLFKQHWCDHTASVSIYVREHEWLEVGAWVYEHFDDITGISFFPYSDHVYQQAPYEELSEDQFKALVAKTPQTLDVTRLAEYETSGTTTMQHELACVGGACDIT